jgi:hypothetical protein
VQPTLLDIECGDLVVMWQVVAITGGIEGVKV